MHTDARVLVRVKRSPHLYQGGGVKMVLETYRGTHFLRYFSFVIDCKSMSNVTLMRGKLFKKKYSQFYFQQLFRLTL